MVSIVVEKMKKQAHKETKQASDVGGAPPPSS
jgi:hypothetical protein